MPAREQPNLGKDIRGPEQVTAWGQPEGRLNTTQHNTTQHNSINEPGEVQVVSTHIAWTFEVPSFKDLRAGVVKMRRFVDGRFSPGAREEKDTPRPSKNISVNSLQYFPNHC